MPVLNILSDGGGFSARGGVGGGGVGVGLSANRPCLPMHSITLHARIPLPPLSALFARVVEM